MTTGGPGVEHARRADDASPVIRPYHERDLAAVYAICVQTADTGADARGKYRSDDLMPDLFAGPYLFAEPQLAFVLDDRGRPVGYVLGTADTAAFARVYREQWIPRLAGRYPVPPQPPVTPDDQMLALHYRPERLLWPGLPEYPAHLHIDLLPAFQAAGHGRQLMETFFAAAAQSGAPGVHVCVVAANVKAVGFYRRLGFGTLLVDEPGGVIYLGRKLLLTRPPSATGTQRKRRGSGIRTGRRELWHRANGESRIRE
jgi:ribosomal protein S18 acetylase RimI-like enzyme